MDSIVESEIIERLKQKFIDFDIDHDDFCNLLTSTKSILSGSFLLQVIQNKFFVGEPFDIDIFTFGNKNTFLEKKIYDLIKKAIYKKTIANIKNSMNEKEFMNFLSTDGHTAENYEDCTNVEDDFKFFCSNISNMQDVEQHFKFLFSNISDVQDVKIKQQMYKELNAKFWNTFNGRILDSMYNVKIIDKYKGIDKCLSSSFSCCTNEYKISKINCIVDFEYESELLTKHQLIYYDDKNYKNPTDITDTFDFDFCANYFDGKNIYIKNLDSINSASCTLNLKQLRIYNNENKRIVKYMKRGYYINAKYGDDIYEIAYLSNDDKDKQLNVLFRGPLDTKKLIIICSDGHIDLQKYLNNLPFNLEKIIVYTYPVKTIIDNLPITIQEMRLYIWKAGSGIEGTHKDYSKDQLEQIEKNNKYDVENAINNIKKIPFGCEVFVNDELIVI